MALQRQSAWPANPPAEERRNNQFGWQGLPGHCRGFGCGLGVISADVLLFSTLIAQNSHNFWTLVFNNGKEPIVDMEEPPLVQSKVTTFQTFHSWQRLSLTEMLARMLEPVATPSWMVPPWRIIPVEAKGNQGERRTWPARARPRPWHMGRRNNGLIVGGQINVVQVAEGAVSRIAMASPSDSLVHNSSLLEFLQASMLPPAAVGGQFQQLADLFKGMLVPDFQNDHLMLFR